MLASVNAVNSIMMALSGQSFKVSNFAAKWKSTSSACIAAEREKKRESVSQQRGLSVRSASCQLKLLGNTYSFQHSSQDRYVTAFP